MVIGWIIGAIVLFFLVSWKVVYEYERGVRFTFGKYAGIMEPGLRIVVPVIHQWRRIDMRTRVIDVPEQDTMTRDNVSVRINAVVYYRIIKADLSVIKVEDFEYAIGQLSQTTMRNSCGSVTLDELLGNREAISQKIQEVVDKASDPWGIKVIDVELKDVKLPADMVRTIAKQAEAERERRAVIIKAEGEMQAAANLIKAAGILGKAEGAMHLRTLQTLNDMSSDQSNSITFFLPLEVTEAMERR